MPKILIVDDDDGIRQIYARYLKADGYTVLECDNVERALDFAPEEPEVVLLDMQLSEGADKSVLKSIRTSYPLAKIVMFSCFDLHFQKQAVENADEYFNKSEGCRALSAKLKMVLA